MTEAGHCNIECARASIQPVLKVCRQDCKLPLRLQQLVSGRSLLFPGALAYLLFSPNTPAVGGTGNDGKKRIKPSGIACGWNLSKELIRKI